MCERPAVARTLETCMTRPVLLVDRPFDGCAVLTLNRPDAMNALSAELRRLLAETVAGLEADPVPLAREAAADGRNVVFRPAANMPALRETADIASNSESEYIRTYRYRLPGETTWKVLLAGETLNGAAAVPLEDACGTMRAFGAYTRGAVQALAEATESGICIPACGSR